uniref:Uncharacterized protein n=1 Tax=Ciona intestinalis TaxID=7719 RepID=H2XPM8_CIOIN
MLMTASLYSYLSFIISGYLCGELTIPGEHSRGGFGSSGFGRTVNFCRIETRKRNISVRAKFSPKQC